MSAIDGYGDPGADPAGEWQMPERCRHYLEARVPDTVNHTRETVIIQCDRLPHPRGVHRYKDEITWSTP